MNMREVVVQEARQIGSPYGGNAVVEQFLNLKGINSRDTFKAYERDIRLFFQVSDVKDITVEMLRQVHMYHVENWLMNLIESNYMPTSIQRKFTALSSLYDWLGDYDNSISNVFKIVSKRRPKVVESDDIEILTTDECKAILNLFDESSRKELRNKLYFSLALNTAFRLGELLAIEVGNIRFGEDFTTITVIGKGKKKAVKKIQKDTERLLKLHIQANGLGRDSKLFTLSRSGIDVLIKATCKKVGITKKVSSHTFRHTAITLASMGGARIEQLRDFANHSSISTTNRYLHNPNRLEDNASDYINLEL